MEHNDILCATPVEKNIKKNKTKKRRTINYGKGETMLVSNCCGALPLTETHDDLGFCSECKEHAVFENEGESNGI